jgi:hypothetical protein
MDEQCREAIYNYADEETQMNAALFGEHKEYVELVITLIRGDYHGQVKSGATEYVISDNIAEILQAECPW